MPRSLLTAAACAVLALSSSSTPPVRPSTKGHDSQFSPVTFEENRGQFDPHLRYGARGSRASTYITSDGALLVALRPSVPDGVAAVMRVTPVGANPAPDVDAVESAPGHVHVFRGNDPQRWVRDIPTFRRVRVGELYPGIDVEYYGTGDHLEYDFIVAPGRDPSAIRLYVWPAG